MILKLLLIKLEKKWYRFSLCEYFLLTHYLYGCVLTCEEPQERRAESGESPVSPDEHVSCNYLNCVFLKYLSIWCEMNQSSEFCSTCSLLHINDVIVMDHIKLNS